MLLFLHREKARPIMAVHHDINLPPFTPAQLNHTFPTLCSCNAQNTINGCCTHMEFAAKDQPIYSIISNQFINMMASIKHGLYELECDVKRVCRGNTANVMVKKIQNIKSLQQMLLYSVQSIKSRFWF
uniref:Uncharacterized protein n=1 Tax=Glossina palpalis gambiensis TaxID=67801 RepID=A0A1B0BEE5_9MUSC